MSNTAKVKALRAVMQNKGIAAVIIPTADPHQSEYPAECWKDREWISGFTGSAGVVVIGREVAGLWADSRYYLQAEEELKDGAITLFKVKNQFAPEHIEWLCETLTAVDEVAIDGEDISKSQYDQYDQMLDKKGIVLKTIDLVSEIWTDRPALPSAPAFLLEAPYPGNTRAEKLAMIRKTMHEKLADHHLMTSLDDIAWTFNLRGRDVAFNPLVVAHALVSPTSATLYMDAGKLDEKSIAELAKDHIQIQPYSQIVADLNHLSAGQTVLVEAATINTTLYKAINGQLLHGDAPARIAKGVKTASEIEHLRATMVKDGVALVKAFKWLEDNLGKTTITEAGFGDIIAQFRSEQDTYQGESFNAIVGYQGNGAIVHYHPDHHHSAEIKPEGILLVDCGGQYLGGTTDITRTIALSKPDHQQQRHYTLVLKGHIAIARVIYPEGTCGAQLDVLARQFLWQHGLNYLHGTGHGIGYFLNVHEGPHGFAGPGTEKGRTAFLPGMVISNEPGLYLENQYGIRIENVIVVSTTQMPGYLDFETVSFMPFDKELIDESILDAGEKAWINRYHTTVYEKLSSGLDEEHKAWLKNKCILFG